jgi:hypothetical protein
VAIGIDRDLYRTVANLILSEGGAVLNQQTAKGVPKIMEPESSETSVWFYQLNALSPEPLIYFLVLGMAKDTRSVAAIRPFYEKYKKIVDTEPVTA